MTEAKLYKMRLMPLFIFTAVNSVAATFTWLGIQSKIGPNGGWMVPAIAVPACFLLSLVVKLAFKIQVRDTAISGQDFYGRAITMPFADIESVSLFAVPLIPFYRFHSKSNSPQMWVPRFLIDELGFHRQILELLPETPEAKGLIQARLTELGGA